MPDEAHIRWDYEGKPDPLMGTGATRAERSLVWIAGLVTLAFYAVIYQTVRLDWQWWQAVLPAPHWGLKEEVTTQASG